MIYIYNSSHIFLKIISLYDLSKIYYILTKLKKNINLIQNFKEILYLYIIYLSHANVKSILHKNILNIK